MKAADLFRLPKSLQQFSAHFDAESPPWQWVASITAALSDGEWVQQEGSRSDYPAGLSVRGSVWVHSSVRLPNHGVIEGPAFIGPECELRPGVYIRGNVIAGRGCVLGNSCEFKNALLMDGVQVPHFSYAGDSVLGNGAHLGAGAILSNFRFDQQPVAAWTPQGKVSTGRRKLGAMIGEGAELGCHAVLQPGSILGPRSVVMTGLVFNGYLEAETLAYTRQTVSRVERRDL